MATINLPTLAHTMTLNGSTKTASSSGSINLGNVCNSFYVNGTKSTIPSTGIVTVTPGSANSGFTSYWYNVAASGWSPGNLYFCWTENSSVLSISSLFPSAKANSAMLAVRIYGGVNNLIWVSN